MCQKQHAWPSYNAAQLNEDMAEAACLAKLKLKMWQKHYAWPSYNDVHLNQKCGRSSPLGPFKMWQRHTFYEITSHVPKE